MDRYSNREESPERGAEGPEPSALPDEPVAAESDSESVFVSDDELGAAAPAPVDDPEPSCQGQQHRHCPTCTCFQPDFEEFATRQEVGRLEGSLVRVVEHQEELVSSLERLVTTFSDFAINDRAHARRQEQRARYRRDTSGERHRERRRQSRWEPVHVLSPARDRQRPDYHRRDSPDNRGPSRFDAHPRRPERPPLSLRQELNVSPSSVSRIGIRMRETYPQFTAAARRNTRNYLLEIVINIREADQNRDSDAGWDRLLTYLRNFSPYTTEEQARLAWQLAFEQPPYAHFRSLWNRGLELLRAALPEDNYVSPADLIRF